MSPLPFKLNQDRRHHIPKQKHNITNWPAYEASLRQRGSLTVWFTDEAIQAWAAARTTRGGQSGFREGLAGSRWGYERCGQRLRDRARQLGLADATVAERLGLSQQRYFNYVSDQTEPDLETLLRICRALDTTPNAVLGTELPRPEAGEPKLLRARIVAAAGTMAVATLRVTAAVVDVLAREHRPEAASTPARKERGRRPGGPPK